MSTARKNASPSDVSRLKTSLTPQCPDIGDQGVELPATHVLKQRRVDRLRAIIVKLAGNAGAIPGLVQVLVQLRQARRQRHRVGVGRGRRRSTIAVGCGSGSALSRRAQQFGKLRLNESLVPCRRRDGLRRGIVSRAAAGRPPGRGPSATSVSAWACVALESKRNASSPSTSGDNPAAYRGFFSVPLGQAPTSCPHVSQATAIPCYKSIAKRRS